MNIRNLFKSKTPEKQAGKSISPQQLTYFATDMVEEILQRSANWIKLNEAKQYLTAWELIPDLRIIMSKLVSYFNQVELIHYKIKPSKLKVIENSPLIELFNNPNPLQSKSEFLGQMYLFFKLTGNCFIYSNNLPGFDASYNVTQLFNLNPADTKIDIIKNQYYYDEKNINKLIKEFQYKTYSTKANIISLDNVMFVNDINTMQGLENYIEGNSKLKAMRYQLTNLGIAYEAKNVLLSRRGALGILSSSGNGQYAFPLTDQEQESLQQKWQHYGLTRDQWQIVFTKASLTWQQISMSPSDLMIYEGLEDDRKMLCAAYSLPYLLFVTGGGEGSTFSNMSTAAKQVYREAIIPDWKLFETSFNNYFKLKEKGEYLEFSYKHIDVLQEDKKLESERKQQESNSLKEVLLLFNTGQLTEDQAEALLTIQEYEPEFINNLLKDGPDNSGQEGNTISDQE